MNVAGFTISSPFLSPGMGMSLSPTPVSALDLSAQLQPQQPQPQAQTETPLIVHDELAEQERLLDRLGLSLLIIESSRGEIATAHMYEALNAIDDPENALSPRVRLSLCQALLHWQTVVPEQERERIFAKYHFKILEIIRFLALEKDDDLHELTPVSGDITAVDLRPHESVQSVGRALALFFTREIESERTRNTVRDWEGIEKDVIAVIRCLVDNEVTLTESVSVSVSASETVPPAEETNRRVRETAASIRCEAMLSLLRCLPATVSDEDKRNSLISLYLSLASHALPTAPSLSLNALTHCFTLCAPLSHTETETQLSPHIPTLLSLSTATHSPLSLLFLTHCPTSFFSPQNLKIDDYLDDFLQCWMNSPSISPSISDASLCEALSLSLCVLCEEIAETTPSRLFVCVTSLSQVLLTEGIETKYKIIVLGMFSVMARVNGVAVLPKVTSWGAVCEKETALLIPLFKVLAVLSLLGHDASLVALTLLAKIARSGQVTDPVHQAALLDCANIVKDSLSFCNVLSHTTLRALTTLSDSNTPVYQNLLLWNSGKSAKRGEEINAFLQRVGLSNVPTTTSTSFSTSAAASTSSAPHHHHLSLLSSVFHLHGKARHAANMVSPSPLSQTEALAERERERQRAVTHTATETSQLSQTAQPPLTPHTMPQTGPHTPHTPHTAFSMEVAPHTPHTPHTPPHNAHTQRAAPDTLQRALFPELAATPLALTHSTHSTHTQPPQREETLTLSQFIARQQQQPQPQQIIHNTQQNALSYNNNANATPYSVRSNFPPAVSSSSPPPVTSTEAVQRSVADILSPISYSHNDIFSRGARQSSKDRNDTIMPFSPPYDVNSNAFPLATIPEAERGSVRGSVRQSVRVTVPVVRGSVRGSVRDTAVAPLPTVETTTEEVRQPDGASSSSEVPVTKRSSLSLFSWLRGTKRDREAVAPAPVSTINTSEPSPSRVNGNNTSSVSPSITQNTVRPGVMGDIANRPPPLLIADANGKTVRSVHGNVPLFPSSHKFSLSHSHTPTDTHTHAHTGGVREESSRVSSPRMTRGGHLIMYHSPRNARPSAATAAVSSTPPAV